MVWSSSTAGNRAYRRTCYAVALALAAISTSAQTPNAEFCATNKAVLNVGFYNNFRPVSYGADLDPNSASFNVHGGYEADLLSALEALDGANLSFARRAIDYWEEGPIPIWQLAATPEYDIVGGGITILDSRTRNEREETIVAFTSPHVAFRQSVLVRAEDAERLADYANLTRDVRVGVLAGTTGEARLLQITGLTDANGVLAAGSRVETPDGTVEADGSDDFRITSATSTPSLGGRSRLIPPANTMPTVVYLGGETELLQALRDGTIDGVARGVLGNGAAAQEGEGRFVVTAVDATKTEYGGFTVDARDTALLACLNDSLSWLTNGRRIGFVDWVDDSQVFMKRAMLWSKLNDELTLQAGEMWTHPLAGLFPAPAGSALQFAARSDDPRQVVARVEDGALTITPDPYAEGRVGITVTATDASGNRATLRLVATLVPAEPRGILRGWRLPWLAGELPPPTVSTNPMDPVEPGVWTRGVFEDAGTFKDLCQVPRPDAVDRQGATLDENNWLRSWSNDTYLWYDEIEDRDPACCSTPAYFGLLRTTAKTPSGRDRDRFHFTYDTDVWIALSQSGVSAGYGAEFVVLEGRPPRDIRVAYTEPNTPATSPAVALIRGTQILEIDGVDVRAGSDVDTLIAGLFPATGETHEFLVQDPGGVQRSVSMEAATITQDPVQHIRVLPTATGPVGYLLFNDHIATAEAQLVDAIESFDAAEITDLVLDLRYNGGGYLYVANHLAAMIAGDAARGQTFEELQFNDKYRVFNPVTGRRLEPYLFQSRSSEGASLPTLDLERLFVLTGPGTCSASESIINGLRGIDIEVVLIGDPTCGKPYGFYGTDNCGTTYFTIQFKGVNAKGFGDFADGFSPANEQGVRGTEVPGCAVADDFDHQFGDPDEARLQAALQYRIDGQCPAPSGRGTDADRVAESPRLATGGRAVRQPRPVGLKVLDW